MMMVRHWRNIKWNAFSSLLCINGKRDVFITWANSVWRARIFWDI